MDAFLLVSILLVSVVVTTEDDLRGLFENVLEDTLLRYIKSSQPPEKPPKEWLSNREAMDFLDLSKATLQRYRSDGTLPYSKIGGNVFYKREDLLDVLQAHRVTGS